MRLLVAFAFAVSLSAQTWSCVTVSGGTPTITPTVQQACPNLTPAYFTQTAAYSVAAWNSHLGATAWGPTPVNVSGQGECYEPTGANFNNQTKVPSFQQQMSSQGNTCTWYVVVTSYVNAGGTIEPSVSSQGQTSNIPCAPCSCSQSDCGFAPAKAACGCVCSSS
jgi:hypothetical protein